MGEITTQCATEGYRLPSARPPARINNAYAAAPRLVNLTKNRLSCRGISLKLRRAGATQRQGIFFRTQAGSVAATLWDAAAEDLVDAQKSLPEGALRALVGSVLRLEMDANLGCVAGADRVCGVYRGGVRQSVERAGVFDWPVISGKERAPTLVRDASM